MEIPLWPFYVSLVLLVGLFVQGYFTSPFLNSIHSGFEDTPPQPPQPPQAPERVWKPEIWCLVSETVLGRTCVRTNTCAPAHQFASEEACTLTEASPLPLGIADPLGAYYRPFMNPNSQQKDTY